MAKPYVISNGWFSEVYGHPVAKRDMDEPNMGAYNYPGGHPIGVMEHYTAGCGTDLSGLMQSRGYVICNFSVDQSGKVYQYTPLMRGSWHSYEASESYVGIEFSALPGSCPLNAKQREVGVKLNAAIVVAVKNLKGFDIPLRHVSGCPINTAGFKEHADGAMPDRCGWNENVHCDNPVAWWAGGKPGAVVNKGWDAFLGDINETIRNGGEDMNETQANQLEQTADFVKNLVRGITGNTKAGNSDQATAGHNAGDWLRSNISTLKKDVDALQDAAGIGGATYGAEPEGQAPTSGATPGPDQ